MKTAPTLFGIKNCDTVKKAQKWLNNLNIEYAFHDFRSDGITSDQVQRWLTALGAETLVNKRSTTWKTLRAAQQEQVINDIPKAIDIICANPTLIKRPLLEYKTNYHVGFKEIQYQTIFI